MKIKPVLWAALAVCCFSCSKQSPISTDIVTEETADSSLRVNCFITVTPQNRDSVLFWGKKLVDATRLDSGRVDYDLYVNLFDPSRLLIFETWKSPKALSAHENAAHFKTIVPKLRQLAEMSADIMPLAPQQAATASAIDSLVRINGQMTVKEGQRDSLMSLIREMAELSRQDSGCIHYEFFENVAATDHLLLIETWMSRETLENHKLASHFKRLVPEIGRYSSMQAKLFMLPKK